MHLLAGLCSFALGKLQCWLPRALSHYCGRGEGKGKERVGNRERGKGWLGKGGGRDMGRGRNGRERRGGKGRKGWEGSTSAQQ